MFLGMQVCVQMADLDSDPDPSLEQIDECNPAGLERAHLELKRVTAHRSGQQQQQQQEQHGQAAQNQAVAAPGCRLTDRMCWHASKATT